MQIEIQNDWQKIGHSKRNWTGKMGSFFRSKIVEFISHFDIITYDLFGSHHCYDCRPSMARTNMG